MTDFNRGSSHNYSMHGITRESCRHEETTNAFGGQEAKAWFMELLVYADDHYGQAACHHSYEANREAGYPRKETFSRNDKRL